MRNRDEHGLYRRTDSPYWWCWIYVDGKPVCKSTKCTDKRAAAKRRRELEREASGLSLDQPAAYPIKDAVRDFVKMGMGSVADGTAEMYRQKGGHLVRLLGDVEAARLHYDHVHEYIERRKGEGAHPHTIDKELTTLRRVLKLAERRQKRVANWRIVIPEHKSEYRPRDRWLTEKEYAELLLALPPHRADYVRVAVYTGARKGELDRLLVEHVDLGAGLVHLPGTKTDGAVRDIPIEEPLRRVLERLIGAGKKRRTKGALLRPWQNVDRDLPRACRRLGMARVTCNDLRRTFASWLLQRGEEPFTVARLLGHSSMTMIYRVYGQLQQRQLIAAIRRLPDPEASETSRA